MKPYYGPGRPPKPVGEVLSRQQTYKLTLHQEQVLKALVAHTGLTAPELIRDLIKARYLEAVQDEGMAKVERA